MKTRTYKKKRGQTAVEFILLMAVVAGLVTGAGQVFGPSLESALTSLVTQIRTIGWTGGYEVQNPEVPLGPHYSPGEACMSATGQGSSC